jgi:hypothetical protein
MAICFFDSSALVKRYIEETGLCFARANPARPGAKTAARSRSRPPTCLFMLFPL